ncbi:hypothetical protein GCM10009827_118360 [Dactylosporangium maewongense]|uniref:Uncharacterized protein n=1 Tax=Dactylosporangium maewongense TaxID=634393 RepID=A0ABN2DIP1_9ACTN
MSADNREAVARLCQRLDGIPLAIELAAVRLRALSVQQVLDRLEDRYGLLRTGSPAAMPRQQTLRALIYWSPRLPQPHRPRTNPHISYPATDRGITRCPHPGGSPQQ